jgi:hypothetical protein
MDTSAFPPFQRLCTLAHQVFSAFHKAGDHAWMRDGNALHAPYMSLRLDVDGSLRVYPLRRNHAQHNTAHYPLTGGHTNLLVRHAVQGFLDAAGAIAPAVRHPDHLQSQLTVRFSPTKLTVDPDAMPEGAYTLTAPGVSCTYLPAEPRDDLSWRLALLSQVQSLAMPRRYKVVLTKDSAEGNQVTVGADGPFDACLRAAGVMSRGFTRQLLEGHVQIFEEHPTPLDGLDALNTFLLEHAAFPS